MVGISFFTTYYSDLLDSLSVDICEDKKKNNPDSYRMRGNLIKTYSIILNNSVYLFVYHSSYGKLHD